jgi:hypothetical protein
VHFALERHIRRGFDRESGKRDRIHCLEPDRFGCSPLIVNSANTSAQKIDRVIMGAPLNRAHLRRPRMAATQGLGATFERRSRKMLPVRVAAIRRTAPMYAPGARAGLVKSSMAVRALRGESSTGLAS